MEEIPYFSSPNFMPSLRQREHEAEVSSALLHPIRIFPATYGMNGSVVNRRYFLATNREIKRLK
jgi:hypothetical protein